MIGLLVLAVSRCASAERPAMDTRVRLLPCPRMPPGSVAAARVTLTWSAAEHAAYPGGGGWPDRGVRHGEAANPGPSAECPFDDSEAEADPPSHDEPSEWGEPWDGPPPGEASTTPVLADSGFTQQQLSDWRRAEGHFGLASGPARGAARQCRRALAIGGCDGDPFRRAATFSKPLAGYVFTTRDGVTGYYRDQGRESSRSDRVVLALDALVPFGIPPANFSKQF